MDIPAFILSVLQRHWDSSQNQDRCGPLPGRIHPGRSCCLRLALSQALIRYRVIGPGGVHRGQNIRIDSGHQAVVVLLLAGAKVALVFRCTYQWAYTVHLAADLRVRAGILKSLMIAAYFGEVLNSKVVAGQVAVGQRVNVGAAVLGLFTMVSPLGTIFGSR